MTPRNPSPPSLAPPQFPSTALLGCLWTMLTLVALWRTSLTFHLLIQPSLATGMGVAVINWRRLDQFVAWFALLLLVLADGTSHTSDLRRRRIARLWILLFSAAIVLTALSILWDEFELPDAAAAPVGWAADLLMALAALILAGKQLAFVFRALQKSATTAAGLTLLDLWRFIAAQWTLFMVAAMLALRASLPKNGLIESEFVRSLLFQLPAVAVLPQAMMIAGIAWTGDLLTFGQLHAAPQTPPPRPRPRAWFIALLLINLAALFMIPRQPSLGIPGSLLGIVSVILYLTGFPRTIWRSLGGKTMIAAWLLLIAAWIGLLIERLLLAANQPVSTYAAGAWRHLWTGGAVLWLLAMATLASEKLLAPAQQLRSSPRAVIALWIAGVLLTAAILWLTSFQQGESQVPILRFLFVTTLPEFIALFIAGATFVRSIKLQHR